MFEKISRETINKEKIGRSRARRKVVGERERERAEFMLPFFGGSKKKVDSEYC
jgi:hypothetical protein